MVAKAATPLPPLGVPVWIEPDEPTHPLAGLVSRARAGGRRPSSPWPATCRTSTAELLAPARRRTTGPRSARADHPFPGRYEPSALPVLREALAREAPAREALAALAAAELGAPREALLGVNTPGELAAAARVGPVPPSAEQWIEAFAAALGQPPPTAEQQEAVLKLASVAAHASERRAAPIACWLAADLGRLARRGARARAGALRRP